MLFSPWNLGFGLGSSLTIVHLAVLQLVTPEQLPVPRDGNLPCDWSVSLILSADWSMLTGQVDPQLLQPADVLHPGEVDVDQVPRHVARWGEGIEGVDEVRVLIPCPAQWS